MLLLMTPLGSVLAGLALRFFGSTALLLGCTAGFAAAALLLLLDPRAGEI